MQARKPGATKPVADHTAVLPPANRLAHCACGNRTNNICQVLALSLKIAPKLVKLYYVRVAARHSPGQRITSVKESWLTVNSHSTQASAGKHLCTGQALRHVYIYTSLQPKFIAAAVGKCLVQSVV